MDVHIARGRITSIVARGLEPLPARVVDARDLTMVPGMIDLHVHQSSLAGERLGRCWLYYGVTTVREISDDPIAATQRAEIWASGKSPGPRLVIAPSATTSESTSDLPMPRGKSVIAHATPRMLGLAPIAAGAPGSLPGLVDRDAQNAPALGLRLSALGLGYQDVTSALSRARTVVVPSLAALDPDTAGRRAPHAPCDIPTGSGLAAPEGFREGFGDTLRRLLAAGGYVGIGSDAPLTPYGAGFHAEMRHLSAAGVANDRLLRLATAEAALALGLDAELGTLEAGKLADFLVLAGDPLSDLGALDHIVAVIKDGVWIDRAQLVTGAAAQPTMLPEAKSAERP